MRKIAITAIIIIFLASFGIAVAQKENQLANGRIVILELAPVDPLSLMQGHYMQLDFALARDIENALNTAGEQYVTARTGAAVVSLDKNNLARFVRLYDGSQLNANELILCFKIRNDYVQLASGAFFFQEGHAQYYDTAQYGELRLDKNGNPLITNLLNSDFMPIKGPNTP